MTSVHRNDSKSEKPTLLNYEQKGSYTFTCEVMFFQKTERMLKYLFYTCDVKNIVFVADN